LLEEWSRNKLTKQDKRGIIPGTSSAKEYYADKRGIEHTRRDWTEDEVRNAQVVLAEMALEMDEPEVWLREVLQTLGLFSRAPVQQTGYDVCGVYAGSKRGLDQHLRTYSRPCNMCDEVRRKAEAERLHLMGLKEESEKWTISSSC